jgi:dolichyl-phosphate beta-glucosyltransferase
MKTVLVIPCHNEERRLIPESLQAFLIARPEAGLVLVDDGSTDGTRGVLDRLAANFPGRAFVEGLSPNRGKGEAVRAGLRRALAAGAVYAGYWDADLSTPLEMADVFEGILDARPALAGVLGSRLLSLGRRIERRHVRHYLGRIFATAVGIFTPLPVYDSQCGAKLFRAGPLLSTVLEEPFRSRWAFDVELLLRLCRTGGCLEDPGRLLWEEPLPVWVDVPGSKVSWIQGLKAFWDLYRLRSH